MVTKATMATARVRPRPVPRAADRKTATRLHISASQTSQAIDRKRLLATTAKMVSSRMHLKMPSSRMLLREASHRTTSKVLHKMASRKTITTSAETIITISAAMMRTATSSLMETSVLVQRTMFAQAAMVVAEALHRRSRVLPSNRRSRTPRVPVIANMLQW